MDSVVPRYRREPPAEQVPLNSERPHLAICQVVDDRLVLPRDVRAQFMTDAIWGNEWRTILQSFDKAWSVDIGKSEVPSAPDQPTSSANAEDTMIEEAAVPYPTGEPVTIDKLKEKHGDPICELPVPDTPLTLIVVSGPGLYITAKQSYKLARADGAILYHGAGTWLMGDKAKKFEGDKGVPCRFANDSVKVIFEDWFQTGTNKFKA